MRKSFPLPLAVAEGPSEDYRYATRCGPLRLVGCDTTQPGRDDGAFGDERLAWLEARLTEDRDTPTIVAMHHLPLPTGIPAMDALGLPRADRVAIDELVAAFPHVGLIVTGHVHRAVVGTLGGCAVFACPSTHMQLVLDLREPTARRGGAGAAGLRAARRGRRRARLPRAARRRVVVRRGGRRKRRDGGDAERS